MRYSLWVDRRKDFARKTAGFPDEMERMIYVNQAFEIA